MGEAYLIRDVEEFGLEDKVEEGVLGFKGEKIVQGTASTENGMARFAYERGADCFTREIFSRVGGTVTYLLRFYAIQNE